MFNISLLDALKVPVIYIFKASNSQGEEGGHLIELGYRCLFLRCDART